MPRLSMYLNQELIQSIACERPKHQSDLNPLIESLKQVHQRLISYSVEAPQFFLEGLPSQLNWMEEEVAA